MYALAHGHHRRLTVEHSVDNKILLAPGCQDRRPEIVMDFWIDSRIRLLGLRIVLGPNNFDSVQ
jgi:hypothetical protein